MKNETSKDNSISNEKMLIVSALHAVANEIASSSDSVSGDDARRRVADQILARMGAAGSGPQSRSVEGKRIPVYVAEEERVSPGRYGVYRSTSEGRMRTHVATYVDSAVASKVAQALNGGVASEWDVVLQGG